jgi:hypothetical protein
VGVTALVAGREQGGICAGAQGKRNRSAGRKGGQARGSGAMERSLGVTALSREAWHIGRWDERLITGGWTSGGTTRQRGSTMGAREGEDELQEGDGNGFRGGVAGHRFQQKSTARKKILATASILIQVLERR